MKRYSQNDIDTLSKILKNDGVISVPTDTVYGICAIATSKDAQDNLRKVKNRPLTKAFPIMCSNKEQIKQIAEIDSRSEKIIDELMPGPLTIILNKNKNLPEFINGGLDTLAIRLATSKPLEKLIEQTGPLFMTSANQSGYPECQNLDEIEKQCPDLDAMMEGNVSFGQASTIVDCSKKEIKILREGPISLEEILHCLN